MDQIASLEKRQNLAKNRRVTAFRPDLLSLVLQFVNNNNNKFVRPRWPYDMRPSVRAKKYIRDAGP